MTTLTHLSPAPVIDETVRLLTEHYVFPEVAAELGSLLRRRFAEGSYDVDSAEELGGSSPRTCSPSTATAI